MHNNMYILAWGRSCSSAVGAMLQGNSWEMLTLGKMLIIVDRMAELSCVDNILCILQRCRKDKKLAYSKRVHAHISNNGLESHSVVGNYIVPMLVDCGSVPDAQLVFNKLVHQSEHSWTSLISGYLQSQQTKHALQVYKKMQCDSVHASKYTIMALLKAFARQKDLERGREIHVEIAQKKFEGDLPVVNTLLDMYAKCGSLLEAREVFCKLPVPDVVSWTALIAGYTEHGSGQEAVKYFEQMQMEGVGPNAVTFICALKACSNLVSIEKGRKVHVEIINKGCERDLVVGNTLVYMYSKFVSLREAQGVFNQLPVRDVVSWAALIGGYAKHGPHQEALRCFGEMQLQGIILDAVTFVCLLKACGSMGAIDKGKEIHREILQKRFEGNLLVGSALVNMYTKCNSLLEAREVFDKLPFRDVVLWTVLIAGYAEHGTIQEALKCFEQMQVQGVSPNAVTFIYVLKACGNIRALGDGREMHFEIVWKGLERDLLVGNSLVDMYAKCGSLPDAQGVFDNLAVRNNVSWSTLIKGYTEHGLCQEALNCYDQMQLEGFPADAATFVFALKACGSLGAIQKGRDLHAEITREVFETDHRICSTLVDMYAKCGSLSEAWKVFDELPLRDVVSWTTLIAGYAEHGPGQKALKCFEEMQSEGLSPDPVTFVFVLKACGSIGALCEGREIHAEIVQKGFEIDLFVRNSLVDLYSKCGSTSEAREVFESMSVRDDVSWSTLISGYAEHGPFQEALKCLEWMLADGVSPSAAAFVSVLKACSSIRAIDQGREIHVKILRMGLETDLFIGNTLVGIYAKCGLFSEAWGVFDRLPVQGDVSWTTLIAGYADYGLAGEALECFQQMEQGGISPSEATLVSVLKACGSLGAIGKGREIHAKITQKHFERYISVGNSLIDMYARCGAISEARDVFDKLLVRDLFSWTVLIAGYAEHGLGWEALEFFEQMQLEEVSPDTITFICILQACGSLRALEEGRKLHAQITLKGLESDCIGSTLMDMYAKCGSLSEAHKLLDGLPIRDVVCWTALIAGYADHGNAEEALLCFSQMQLEGVSPCDITFACLLRACSRIGDLAKGRKMHSEIAQKGFEKDPFVGNSLINMYAKSGSISEAWEVFDKLGVQDVVSWDALIAGYVEHGPRLHALKCFERMQLEGISPDAVTFVLVLKACSSVGNIHKGRELHMDITQNGFERGLLVGSSLVDMYAKCGSLSEAGEVFDKLTGRDVVSWNTLIAGHAEHGHGQIVSRCFEQMQQEGISPDAATFICILKACGSIGASGQGREIHADIAQMGFERDHLVGNTLVDMYAKCCSISEAREVFDKLPLRDVVSWSAMIEGYGINHAGDLAVQCFDEMQKQCVIPNAITFTCLLTACSHANLVYKGQEYFTMMREQYGIAPVIDHYTCMVDLLARSGHLYEAEVFIETMQCSPSEETWTALLSACKAYGEEDLGRRCFYQLVHMNSESAASYVLMENIYGNDGRWDDADKVEAMRKHAGAKKKPATALIEVDKNMHEFVVGDNQSRVISVMLVILTSRMKGKGHVPNLDIVLRPMSYGKEAVVTVQNL